MVKLDRFSELYTHQCIGLMPGNVLGNQSRLKIQFLPIASGYTLYYVL
jgi:hypothetical protein